MFGVHSRYQKRLYVYYRRGMLPVRLGRSGVLVLSTQPRDTSEMYASKSCRQFDKYSFDDITEVPKTHDV